MAFNFTASGVAVPPQRQWLRQVSLVVGDDTGNGLDLSQLQCKFEIVGATLTTLKHASIRIYNLAADTAKKIQDEYTTIALKVGYDGGELSLIFTGLITYVRRGKENATDSFVDIVAADSDDVYQFATVNTPLSRDNNSLQAQLDAVMNILSLYGVTLSADSVSLPSTNLPRGKALYGSVGEVLTAICKAANCFWFLENRKLVILHEDGIRPGGAIVLSPQTGLISQPVQTVDGLNLRCLLNPLIAPGRLVQVNLQDITQQSYRQNVLQPERSNVPYQPGLSSQNLYKVYQYRHTGDTRGNEWYSEAVCEAIDPSNGLQVASQTWYEALYGNE
jgi:hypothetical protein